MQLEAWDDSSKVTLDKALLNELVSLRFLESRHHLSIVGPVGVASRLMWKLAHPSGQSRFLVARRSDVTLPAARAG
jgi:hypothetical protein